MKNRKIQKDKKDKKEIMKNEKIKKATFTPGPISTKQRPGTVGLALQSDGKTIGTAYNAGDARLWSAAPDLLAALENVLSAIAYNDEPARDVLNLDEIKAAIAKAKGE